LAMYKNGFLILDPVKISKTARTYYMEDLFNMELMQFGLTEEAVHAVNVIGKMLEMVFDFAGIFNHLVLTRYHQDFYPDA